MAALGRASGQYGIVYERFEASLIDSAYLIIHFYRCFLCYLHRTLFEECKKSFSNTKRSHAKAQTKSSIIITKKEYIHVYASIHLYPKENSKSEYPNSE